jgi:tetratricopeptide (TPR) repeat protein
MAALLLVPSSALTPEGIRALVYPLHLARFPAVGKIDEWHGLLSILRVCAACFEEGIAFVVLALGTIALCAFRRKTVSRAGPGTWLLVAGSAAVPFLVYRFLPYAGFILAALVMRRLGELTEAEAATHQAARLAVGRPVVSLPAAGLLLAAAVFLGMRGSRFPLGLGVAPDLFPQGAARFILRADAQGPLFNSFELGSYLIYALFPQRKVFIHTDVWHSVADERFITRFFRSGWDPAIFDALVRDYGLELLVLENRLAAWQFLATDPRWALLYWDQVASVYARRGGANAALIAAAELRLTRYAPDLSYLLPVAQDPTRFPAAAAELRRLVAEDPANRAARLSLAFLLKAAGQALPEALAQVEAVQRQGLQHATLLTWRAELLARLGRPAEAEAAARAALRLTPTARAARLVLADLRAQAGDRAEAIGLLRALLALPDLAPDQRREAEGRLRAMASQR